MDRAEIEELAKEYDGSEDFDYFNTKLASRLICPFCEGKRVLEVGCASGEMTEDLVEVVEHLTVVEPSAFFSNLVRTRFGAHVTVLNCFLEEAQEGARHDVVVLASLLHHVDDAAAFL